MPAPGQIDTTGLQRAIANWTNGMGSFNQFMHGSPQAQADASQAAALSRGLANRYAGNLGYANQALQDAFDPNNSIYNARLTALNDQVKANMAASGVATTPYASSILAGAEQNFLNDWQDRQVGRESTGAGTATKLQGQDLAAQEASLKGLLGAAGISEEDLSNEIKAYGIQGDQLSNILDALKDYLPVGYKGGAMGTFKMGPQL